MILPKGISRLATGRTAVAATLRILCPPPLGRCAPVALAALAGCTDYAYYVRPDQSAGIPVDLVGLDAADLGPQTLAVAVTFKSDGAVQPDSSDTLFRSVEAGLKSSGVEHLQRSGGKRTDVSGEIAALPPADAARKIDTCAIPRLLVLVENHPDVGDGTAVKYFFSGMTFGAWSLSKTTDRYDITLAYEDRHGQARVYHGHQDLIYSTGSTVFGRDQAPVAGLRRYDDADAAFGAAVGNSIKGGPGVVRVGRPDFNSGTPADAANDPRR